MRFTVQYIPISEIKADSSLKITDHIKKLQGLMWDCMNILVVKKNRKDGSYSILSGLERFEYLRKYTKHVYAPCIVDDSFSTGLKSWLNRIRNKQPLDDFPMAPKSWSIFRSFLKKEPRFKNLSRVQQLKVLILAIRYKRTVISSMQTMVNQMIRNKK
ncbi:hypothetical protein ACJ2A9_10655 [Anaerobacillus sp. MEB173]|uniref:hypothetical protein n=1 Tax=Anaerobacillus sp. MEB173 TaxID=3383345 RepID=UPI003F935287